MWNGELGMRKSEHTMNGELGMWSAEWKEPFVRGDAEACLFSGFGRQDARGSNAMRKGTHKTRMQWLSSRPLRLE